MRKLLLSVVLASLSVFMLATVSNAAVVYYHGDFAADSTIGCAKCHVTHAGKAKALLIEGPTQTDFCYYCHKNFLTSPYDAKNGKILKSGGAVIPSVAGGFARSFDFDTQTYDTTAGGIDGNYIASTSMHGVESYDASGWVNGVAIPGANGAAKNLVGDFRCGSCHDPHKGGSYTVVANRATVMPRLLKEDLPAADFTPANFDAWTFTAVEDTAADGFKSRVVTTYGDDSGTWCAGCHNLFNQTLANAGQTGVASELAGNPDRYMHRMNFIIDNDAEGKTYMAAHNIINQIPLSRSDKLTCLTCHRAHGTASTTKDNGGANVHYFRAGDWLGSDTDASLNKLTDSTALLRMKDRQTCFYCHGAATNNTPLQETN